MKTLPIETPYNMGKQNITVLNPDDKEFYNSTYYIGIGHYLTMNVTN